MSTQPMDISTGLAEAQAAFSAGMSGQSTSSAPAETGNPTPEAPASATAAEAPAAPAPVAPETPAPTVEPVHAPNVTDPAAQRFLEMHGGDLNRALAKALEYNNRLAEIHKTPPDPVAGTVPVSPLEPATAAPPAVSPEPPAAPVAPPVPPAPPVQIDPQQIAKEVDERVFADANAKSLIQTFAENTQVINERTSEAQKLQVRVAYLEQKLADPDIAGDDLRKGDIRDEIRAHKLDLGIARNEVFALQQQNERLDTQFRAYKTALTSDVSSRYQRAAQEQAQAAELQQTQQAHYTELVTSWPVAVSRVAALHKMSPDVLADFQSEAKLYAQARLANPEFTLDPANLDTFLAPIAKTVMDRLDRYHRQRSAEYAAQAQQRAASPAPVGTAPVQTGAPQSAPDLESLMDGVANDLRQAMRRR